MVKKDGQSSPRNPTNGYISRYPSNVFGYLGCGAINHLFEECKNNRVPTVRSFYWQELWVHVTKTRKRISPPFDPNNTGSTKQVSSTTQNPSTPLLSSLHQTSTVDTTSTRHGLGRGGQINRPSWQISDKRTHCFAICVTVSNTNFSNQKLIPIAINKSFSSIKMLIGMLSDDENKMSMHVDTGTAMNTGDKTYHQCVMY